jgi:hypothetical protein
MFEIEMDEGVYVIEVTEYQPFVPAITGRDPDECSECEYESVEYSIVEFIPHDPEDWKGSGTNWTYHGTYDDLEVRPEDDFCDDVLEYCRNGWNL